MITIAYNLLSLILSSVLGANRRSIFIFAMVNLCWNILIFSAASPLVGIYLSLI
ncbi:MAG: hypothetical protein HGA85_04630 [Nanoarchaeota archaeon]|nr:hypothetical protein [Nanoarchaeota archaeon]